MKILDEIEADIKDIFNTNFSYSSTTSVPSLDDSSLTFGNGEEKKAKTLETCVLFVDIRNSVSLTEKHSTETMGKIYTSLTKSVLRAARHHNGSIRNIIGDRVMVVFPAENCFENAVHCAATINHAAEFINKQFRNVDFKCGIGIDYGTLKVIKVGLARRDGERSENRGFVWVGKPANIASRLTDGANKIIQEEIYVVTKKPLDLGIWSQLLDNSSPGLLGMYGKSNSEPIAPVRQEMSAQKFAASLSNPRDGQLSLSLYEFIRFERKQKETKYPSILITDNVFDRMEEGNTKRFFKQISHSFKDVDEKVYGCDLIWKI